jgi:hypothetical protein
MAYLFKRAGACLNPFELATAGTSMAWPMRAPFSLPRQAEMHLDRILDGQHIFL